MSTVKDRIKAFEEKNNVSSKSSSVKDRIRAFDEQRTSRLNEQRYAALSSGRDDTHRSSSGEIHGGSSGKFDVASDESKKYDPANTDLLYRFISDSSVRNGDPKAYASMEQTLNKTTKYDGRLKSMNDSERETYTYLTNTEGKDRANKYLDSIYEELGKRYSDTLAEEEKKKAQEHPIASSIKYDVTQPIIGLGAGIQYGINAVAGTILDRDINTYNEIQSIQNAYDEGASAAIEKQTENIKNPILNYAAETALQAGNSALSNTVGAGLFGKYYDVTMGMSAAASKARELEERGASENQMLIGSALSGLAEYAFEHTSLDNLFKNMKLARNVGTKKELAEIILKSVGSQAVVEGGEEFGTEIANTLSDLIVMRGESTFMQDVNGYENEGYSEAQSIGLAALQVAKNAGNAFLVGALSGGLMSGGGTAVSGYANLKTNQRVGQDYVSSGGDTNALADIAKTYGEVKYDTNNLTNAQIGKLYNDSVIGAEEKVKADIESKTKNNEQITNEVFKPYDDIRNLTDKIDNYTDGLTEEESKLFKSMASSDQNYQVLRNSFDLVVEYGRKGLETEAFNNHGILTNEQTLKAYELGIKERNAESKLNEREETKTKFMVDNYFNGLEKENSGTFTTNDVVNNGITLKGVDLESLKRNSRSDSRQLYQTAMVIKDLATKTGFHINMYESTADVNGNTVAPNGFYDAATNTINLDIRAGISSKNLTEAVIPALSHEITHSFRISSPELYDDLYKTLINGMSAKGISGETFLANTRAEMEASALYKGREITNEMVEDEFVAKACEDMLTNSEYAKRLLSQMDDATAKSFGNKVKKQLAKLKARILAVLNKYKNQLGGIHEETQLLRNFAETVSQAQEMWDAMLNERIKYNIALNGNGQNAEGKMYSFSSIGYSFYGNESISAAEFENGDYKQTEGYKKYVADCVKIFMATHKNSNKKQALKEIESSIDGIVRVALAAKKAGYDIFDDATKRTTKDSKNRLLFSSLEPNSDYFTSNDISTICDKRINFSEIHDEIERREEEMNVPANKRFFKNVDNYFYIHKVLADKGLTTPCRQCYVESMRKNLTPMAQAFIKLVGEEDANNKKNDQLYQQTGKNKGELKANNAKLRENVRNLLDESGMSISEITEEMLTTADGLAQIKLQNPLLYEAFNSFYGQSKPKMPKEATPFRFGELIALLTDDYGNISQKRIDKINSTGGFRLQSYSDFQVVNYVDVLQVIFEAGVLNLNGHAYTKVPAFLDATKGTNLKRNISIFMYQDGSEWILDKNDSFPANTIEDIYAIVNADKSGNTSIIAVSQNADMSSYIMANDDIGYGIPFHKSGLKMGTVRDVVVRDNGREIRGYSNIKDHTKQQTEVWATTTKDHKALTKVKNGINIYSFWDFENKEGLSKQELIKKNLKAYIDACYKADYIPKFREYLVKNESVLNKILAYAKKLGSVSPNATIDDISFKYRGYTVPLGYYKFLGDYGMFKPNGAAAPAKALSLDEYDFDGAVEFFKDSEKVRRNEILQQFANGDERKKYRESGLTAEELTEVIRQKRSEAVNDILNKNTVYSARESMPTFYSQMGKVIDESKQNKFGADSLIPYLRGKGVKTEEIKWSGIETFLEGKKSVSKDELSEFVKNSMLDIQIENIASGEYVFDENTGKNISVDEFENQSKAYAEENGYTYTFEKKFNYVEVEFFDEDGEFVDGISLDVTNGTHWSKYKLEGGDNYQELLFKMPGSNYKNQAMQGHWGESGILAHARVQDFETEDGKMLFVDEIQSDWHNAGQKNGYADKSKQNVAEAFHNMINYVREMPTDNDSKFDKYADLINESASDAGLDIEVAYNEENGTYTLVNMGDVAVENGDYEEFVNELFDFMADAEYEADNNGEKIVPDAPFKTTYTDYVMKNLLRMAAEGGYDSIGWTTAQIQIDRWDKRFAEGYRIEYDQDIPKFLQKYGKKWGMTVEKTKLGSKDDGFRDSYGKEYMYKRNWFDAVLAEEEDNPLYSEDIQNGYFEVVQNGNEYNVQNTITGEVIGTTLYAVKGSQEVWSAKLTDAMKESVLYEGQPMYSDREYMDAVNSGDLKTAQKMVDKAAKAAGYKVKAYHGSSVGDITIFRTDVIDNNMGSHFESKSTAKGFAFGEWKHGDENTGRVYSVWLKAQNPYETYDWFGQDDYYPAVEASNLADEIGTDEAYALIDEIKALDEGIAYVIENPDDLEEGYLDNDKDREVLYGNFRKLLEMAGYDSIKYENGLEAIGENDYIIQHSEQIKSADPVTYDDNGNIIPLSQRFNSSSKDIRYSERVLMGSLFSDGGTHEAGLIYQMVDKEFAVENNEKIAAVYSNNHGWEHLFVGDVQKFDSTKHDNVFYLHASPVCKSYSKANHFSGEKELDILTAEATARVLEEQKPQVFTVENVREYIGSEAYTMITDKLDELGYTWDVGVYKASDYGNPTKRERMYIRAVKNGTLPAKPAKVETKTSWGDATRDLWNNLEEWHLNESTLDAISNTPKLQGIDIFGSEQALLIYGTNKSHQVDFAWEDELCPTLTTKCGDARIIINGKVYKPSVQFMGRLQGLPDDYKYSKDKGTAFKVIGNGIPTQLTKAVAGGLLDHAYAETHNGDVLYSDRMTSSTVYLKEETVDRLLDTYAIPSSPNKSKAWIGRIKPGYFAKATAGGWMGLEYLKRETDAFDVDKFTKEKQPIFFDVETDDNGEPIKITGHEGRHRTIALDREGILRTPIILFGDDGWVTDRKSFDVVDLAGQTLNDNSAFVHDLIPLDYAHKEEIIKTFSNLSSADKLGMEYDMIDVIRYSDRTEFNVYEAMGMTTNHEQQIDAIVTDIDYLIDRMSIEKTLTKERVLSDKNLANAAKNLRTIVKSDISNAELIEGLRNVYSEFFNSEIDKAAFMNKARSLALQMIEQPKHDELSQDQKNALERLRGTVIKVTAQQKSEAAEVYGSAKALQNAYFGKLKFSETDGQPIDSFYSEFAEDFGYLTKDINDKDMISALIDTYNALKVTPALESEWATAEGVEHAVEEIYNQFWRLDPITKTTVRNELKHVEDLRLAHQRTMNAIRSNRNVAKVDSDTLYAAAKNMNREIIKAMTEKSDERMAKYRDKQSKEAEIRKILNKSKQLNEKVSKNTADKHVPAEWRVPLANFLSALDFSSSKLLGTGIPTKKDVSIAKAFRDLSTIINSSQTGFGEEIKSQWIDLPDGMKEDFDALSKKVTDIFEQYQDDVMVLRNMSYDELHELYTDICVISASINKMNDLNSTKRFKKVSDAARVSMSELDLMAKLGDRTKAGEWLNDLMMWENMLPFYASRRWGAGGMDIFSGLQDGWDKFAFLRKAITDFADSAYTAEEVNAWEKHENEFTFNGTTFTITDSQLMSMYCTYVRDNNVGLQHMSVGGIVIDNYEKGNKVVNQTEQIKLNEDQIKTMISKLDNRQLDVAKALQKYMSETCAEWGNEVTYQRYGIFGFTETHYFPMKVDASRLSKADTPTDNSNSVFRLLNLSFTKPLTPKAENPIMMRSIFDVFAEHTTDMAKYNALALPILDLYKWYAYTERSKKNAEGQKDFVSVRASLERVYGKKSLSYIWNFMNDLNGTDNGARGEGRFKGFISRYKVAAVAANLRVTLLQPTAYARAIAVIDPKYLVAGLKGKSGYQKAEKYSGIALWKQQGGFDINIARSVKEDIKHTKDQNNLKGKKEKLLELSMKGAEHADRMTWGRIWNACEAYISDTTRMSYGTEEYYKAVADKFRDVIYRTQVVDSTMTRSELMRNKSGLIQGYTAFMSEPTMTENMLADVYYDIKLETKQSNFNTAMKNNADKLRKVMIAYTLSAITQAIFESAVDAARDDDDDELYEKYIEHLIDNLKDEMNPLSKIVIIKDLITYYEQFRKYGRIYGKDDMGTDFLATIGQFIYDLTRVVSGDKEMSYKVVKEGFEAASKTLGIPLSNALREIKTVYNNTFSAWNSSKWK